MKEYKIITAGSAWSAKRLEQKATEKLNIYAQDGWNLVQIRWGYSPWLVPTLYIVLERERTT